MTDGDGDTATATIELPGDGRQRADRPARRRLRSTTTGLPAAIRRARPATSTPTLATTPPTPARRRSPARWAAASAATAPARTASRFAGLNGQSGTVGQETVTYSWNAGSNTLTATTVGGTRARHGAVHGAGHRSGDGRLHGDAARQRAARRRPERRETTPPRRCSYSITDADGSTVTGTLTVTFDDDAPTATAEASQNVAEGATVTGTLDFVARRRRRDGHAHRRHGAGVQPGRRQLLAGDRHRRRLHQGEGGRLVLVHGGRGDAEPGAAGVGDATR